MPSLTRNARRKPVAQPSPTPTRALPEPSPHRPTLRMAPVAAHPTESPSGNSDAAAGRAAPDQVEGHLHALTDVELLSILLARGRAAHEECDKLAQKLLGVSGGLAALPGVSRSMLRYCGLRATQVSALLAACEIACRLARRRIPDREPLTRPEEVARFLTLRYQQRDQEVMGALFLDVRHRLLGDQEIYRGTLHRAAIEPREILKQCLLCGAAAVALFHTHPSGDPTPSAEDVLFTRRMAEAAAVVGVDLVDHLVLGATGRWVSLRQRAGW